MKLVQAWIELHKEELVASWKLLSEGEGFFQIKKMVLGWAAFHQTELQENWELAVKKQELFTIEPLQ